jgi:hypothetical protein
MSMGLAGSFRRCRIDVCDECGEDILDLNDHYTVFILVRSTSGAIRRPWHLHRECFDKRRLDMDTATMEETDG